MTTTTIKAGAVVRLVGEPGDWRVQRHSSRNEGGPYWSLVPLKWDRHRGGYTVDAATDPIEQVDTATLAEMMR